MRSDKTQYAGRLGTILVGLLSLASWFGHLLSLTHTPPGGGGRFAKSFPISLCFAFLHSHKPYGFGEVLSTRYLIEIQQFFRVAEAVPAQAVEAAGSSVAVHHSLTTPARGGKK